MEGTKPWWQSTGILGPIVAIIAWGAKKITGVDIGPADIQPIVDNAVLLVGAVIGMIGRIRATKTTTL